MSDVRATPQDSTALDDLGSTAARFEEDVARIAIWVNGDETAEYLTADQRAVPSITRLIAEVDTMIAPDVATIMQGATTATQAASAAQASAASAAQDAQSSGASAELVESYAVTVAADATAAHDSAQRAEAASDAAGSARDTAVAAQAGVQQNADRASSAATNAAASEVAAAGSASAAAANATQTGLDVSRASGYADNAGASANAASGAEGRAGASATAAAQSASASAASAVLSQAAADQASGVVTGALQATRNLSDVENAATARTNLGAVAKIGDTMTGGLRAPWFGTNAAPAITNVQGAYLGWNESVGTGALSIVNNRGGGAGGMVFRQVNLANNIEEWRFSFDAGGWATFPQNLNALGSIGANGNITAAGNIQSAATVLAAGEVWSGNGTGRLAGDGNTYGAIWGGWISTWLANQFAARDTGISNAQNTANDAWNRANNAQASANSAATESVRRWTGNQFAIGWRGVFFFGVDNSEQATLIGVAVSDQTKKHSIRDIESGPDFRDSLALVNSLKFVSFDYIEQYCNGEHRDIGVIAQECYASFKADDGVQYVDERTLLFDALHAIKELTARVGELETQLATR